MASRETLDAFAEQTPVPLAYEPRDATWKGARKPDVAKYVVRALVGLAIAFVLVGLILPLLHGRGTPAPRVSCASHLRQIAVSCLMYASSNGGKFPESLAIAQQTGRLPNKVFLCPAGKATVPANAPATWADTNGDYVYLGAGLTNAAPASIVVAYERSPAHQGQGINIAYADGTVKFTPTVAVPATMNESAAARQKWEQERRK